MVTNELNSREGFVGVIGIKVSTGYYKSNDDISKYAL